MQAQQNPITVIPDTMQQRIVQVGQVNDPQLKQLDMVSVLGRDASNTLTELSYDEVIDFAIIEAIHKEGILDLSAVVTFINLLKTNRVALDRKGVSEYLKGIIGQPVRDFAPYGMPGTVEEDKPGVLSRLMFWRKDR